MTQTNQPPPEYVGPEDIATHYGVSPETVRRWCREGLVPGAFQLGRQWRIPRKWMIERLDLTSGGDVKGSGK